MKNQDLLISMMEQLRDYHIHDLERLSKRHMIDETVKIEIAYNTGAKNSYETIIKILNSQEF